MESKTGLGWGLAMEFFEQPVVIVEMDEGGDGGTEFGEVLAGAAVDICSLRVRWKRSTTPLVSGSPGRAKLGAKPWKRALDWK